MNNQKTSEVKMKTLNSPLASHKRSYKGLTCVEKCYIDVKVVDVVQKTGDGENDYVIVPKKVETKRDIAQFIEAQSSTVGVSAYKKRLAIEGSSVPVANVTDKVEDWSKSDIDSLISASNRAKEAFATLDPELKGNAKTYEEFLSTFNDDKLNAFIEKKISAMFAKKSKPKEEVE